MALIGHTAPVRCFRLQYRPDMDASLQFAPVEVAYSLDRIHVMGPEDDFGWLHPLRLRKFVVDGVLWEAPGSGRFR